MQPLRFRSPLLMACSVLLACSLWAQTTPKTMLDASETVFTVFAAMNACGYDQGLAASDPLRTQVRTEIARAAQSSDDARAAVEETCLFYRDHQQADPARNEAQYISLALNLGDPPAFPFTIKEADLPPDAAYVAGLQPRLKRFYQNIDLHRIWMAQKRNYDAVLERFHEPIGRTLQSTELYLRLPITNYTEARFAVFLEMMGAPGQVNSRNYGTNYLMVVTPTQGSLPVETIDRIRHTYLHYILDPMAAKRARALQRIEPIMDQVKTAPMDEAFKEDVGLLMTESLIRAVEVRMSIPAKSKDAEAARSQQIQKADQEGFVLAPYFYQQLAAFEKGEEGLQLAYPTWLLEINVDGVRKHAEHMTFAASATSEDMQAQSAHTSPLQEAEKRLAAGDFTRAQQLAQKALDQKRDDPARALFILAQVATVNKDMNGARNFFERTLAVAREPRLIAWSHIYLGRICDLRAERDQAVEHYRAALQAGDSNPATRTAAERGLNQPYEPPDAAQRRTAEDDPDEKDEKKNTESQPH